MASKHNKYTLIRFNASERYFYNIVMVTYFILLGTGLVIIIYNIKGDRNQLRETFILAHKVAGILFITGTLTVVALGDKRTWIENIKVLFWFTKADIEWIVKKPFTIFLKDIKLPEADKFNAGQKIWHAIAFVGSMVLASSGVYLWINHLSIIVLLIHTALAILMILPLMGHLYMALINRDTRPGFTSIVHGRVNRNWAKSHHPVWARRKEKTPLPKIVHAKSIKPEIIRSNIRRRRNNWRET